MAAGGDPILRPSNTPLNQIPGVAGATASACAEVSCASPLANIANHLRGLVGMDGSGQSPTNRTILQSSQGPASTAMERENDPDLGEGARKPAIERAIEATPTVDANIQIAEQNERIAMLQHQLELIAAATREQGASRRASGAEDPDSFSSLAFQPRITTLTTAVLQSHKTDLAPGGVPQWCVWARPVLAKNTKLWNAALDLPEDAFLARLDTEPDMQAQDEHNAAMITAMLDPTSPHVRAFKAEVAERDATAAREGSAKTPIVSSGYRLWHAITASAQCGVGAQRMSRMQAFKDTNYFGLAQTYETFVLAAHTLRADFMLLPESARRGEHALERAMLDRMPSAIESEVAAYRKKIEKREALGQPLKWSYDEMVKLLAIEVVAAATVTGTAKKASSATNAGVICVRCGQRGHKAGDKRDDGTPVCVARCEHCGSRVCPGCRASGLCEVMKDVMTPRTELRNAAGDLYDKKIYDILAAHREKTRTAKGLQPTAKAARTIDASSGADDDEGAGGAGFSLF